MFTGRGRVCWVREEFWNELWGRVRTRWEYVRAEPDSIEVPGRFLAKAGIAYWNHKGAIVLLLPVWPFFALTAILPALWLTRRWRTHHRRKHDLCLTCGYDLTANTSGVCPECGAAITANQKQII
jgi:hypothetical protein